MKRIMKRAASLVLATALVVTGVYCGGTDAQAAKKAKKITMNKKKVNITVGGKFTLKVKKVTPKKASKAVTYKTSNKKVATVTKKGVITGKKKGTAKITVTSKSNKKVKATVKVTVADKPVVTPAPVVNPTASAIVAPTEVPANTTAPAPTATPTKAARTTRPPATPTPVPTPPSEMLDHGSAPYTLEFNEDTIQIQGETEKDEEGNVIKDENGFTKGQSGYKINEDGSVTIFVKERYCGIGFKVPADLKENNFDTVTVTYKDVVNIGGGYGCGLWRTGDNKDTEDVIDWAGIFAEADEEGNPITSGEYTATIAGKGDGTNAWYVNKILLFHNDEVHDQTPSAQVTITKIVFSHSEYKGGEEGPTNPPETTDVPDFAASKISAPVTVDGIADDAWADVPELPISNRVVCDNKGDSTTAATAKLAWDENNLYGLVKVTDENIDAAAENDYQRDGVEFFLDEDNSKDKGWDNNTDAFQYRFTGLTKADDGTANAALTSGFAGGSSAAKADYAGVETAYSFTDEGYVVEFKIPFKAAKQAGDLVGFDLIVQDCKDGGRDAEIYLKKTEEALKYYNLEDTFGTLKLEDNTAQGGENEGGEQEDTPAE